MPTVYVTAHRGFELASKDDTGFSDPYCIISFRKKVVKTKACAQTLHPCWRETFSFEWDASDTDTTVKVLLKDYDKFTRDDYMGECSIDIAPLFTSSGPKYIEGWYTLSCQPPHKGEVSGSVFFSFSKTPDCVPKSMSPSTLQAIGAGMKCNLSAVLCSQDFGKKRETLWKKNVPLVVSGDGILLADERFVDWTEIISITFQQTNDPAVASLAQKKLVRTPSQARAVNSASNSRSVVPLTSSTIVSLVKTLNISKQLCTVTLQTTQDSLENIILVRTPGEQSCSDSSAVEAFSLPEAATLYFQLFGMWKLAVRSETALVAPLTKLFELDSSSHMEVLRDYYLSSYKGGFIKFSREETGEYEEWSYSPDGTVFLPGDAGSKYEFRWNGYIFVDTLGCDAARTAGFGKWDGACMTWNAERLGRPVAQHFVYHIDSRTFVPVTDSDEVRARLTMQWTRHFLAAKNVPGSGVWIVEGSVPHAVVMCLQCLQWALAGKL